ncbi:MAG: thiol-disulfide oxidoreductase-like protein [Fibrobacteres bacterium]|nr:thiol-disulfide oxidoreductase-like protein [Fibrobacterota bacterium]
MIKTRTDSSGNPELKGNPPMKRIVTLLIAFVFCGCATNGQRRGPSEPVSRMSNFDYGVDVLPTDGNKKQLSDFKGKKISIYYLSPKCPHCRHAMPHIEKARKILDSAGYERINICIKYSTDEDYTNFIRDEKLTGYCFKDADRNFANKYGTGSVPVFLVVNDSGDVVRYNSVSDTLGNQVAANLNACCKD